MIVKDLIEKLNTMPQDLPVVLCDLNYDGDGDGEVRLPEIKSIDGDTAITLDGLTDCVFINFEGRI